MQKPSSPITPANFTPFFTYHACHFLLMEYKKGKPTITGEIGIVVGSNDGSIWYGGGDGGGASASVDVSNEVLHTVEGCMKAGVRVRKNIERQHVE